MTSRQTADPREHIPPKLERLLSAALSPNSVSIDDRDMADLLNFTARYAELIRFYDIQNKENGNWSPFLLKDPRILTAVISKTNFQQLYTSFNHLHDKLNGHIACSESEEKSPQLPLENPTQPHKKIIISFQLLNQYLDCFYSLYSMFDFWLQHMSDSKGEYPLKQYFIRELSEVFAPQFMVFLRNIPTLIALFAPAEQHEKSLRILRGSDFNALLTILEKHHSFTPSSAVTPTAFIIDSQKLFVQSFEFLVRVVLAAKETITTLLQQKNDYPDTTLLMAFINLMKLHQNQLNQLSDSHLNFYYRDILKTKPAVATPDKTILFIELNPKVKRFLLPENTLFNAGYDDKKQPVYFQSTSQTWLDNTRLVGLWFSQMVDNIGTASHNSLILNKDPNSGAVVRSETGTTIGWQPAEVPDSSSSSSTSSPVNGGPQHVTPGFVIASPMLLLKSGNRQLVMTLFLSKPLAFDAFRNAKMFFSSVKGWLEIAPSQINSDKDPNVEPKGKSASSICLHFSLLPSIAAITMSEKPLDSIVSQWPMFKLVFANISGLEPRCELVSLDFSLKVEEAAPEALLNDHGALQIKGPLALFGNAVEVDSNFYIGSRECFAKPITGLQVKFHWEHLPTTFISYFVAYNYYLQQHQNIDPDAFQFNEQSFQVTWWALRKNSWQKLPGGNESGTSAGAVVKTGASGEPLDNPQKAEESALDTENIAKPEQIDDSKSNDFLKIIEHRIGQEIPAILDGALKDKVPPLLNDAAGKLISILLSQSAIGKMFSSAQTLLGHSVEKQIINRLEDGIKKATQSTFLQHLNSISNVDLHLKLHQMLQSIVDEIEPHKNINKRFRDIEKGVLDHLHLPLKGKLNELLSANRISHVAESVVTAIKKHLPTADIKEVSEALHVKLASGIKSELAKLTHGHFSELIKSMSRHIKTLHKSRLKMAAKKAELKTQSEKKIDIDKEIEEKDKTLGNKESLKGSLFSTAQQASGASVLLPESIFSFAMSSDNKWSTQNLNKAITPDESHDGLLRVTLTAPVLGFGQPLYPKVVSYITLLNAKALMHEVSTEHAGIIVKGFKLVVAAINKSAKAIIAAITSLTGIIRWFVSGFFSIIRTLVNGLIKSVSFLSKGFLNLVDVILRHLFPSHVIHLPKVPADPFPNADPDDQTSDIPAALEFFSEKHAAETLKNFSQENLKELPNQPYVPQLSVLTLNYTVEHSVSLAVSKKGTAPYPLQLFHLGSFDNYLVFDNQNVHPVQKAQPILPIVVNQAEEFAVSMASFQLDVNSDKNSGEKKSPELYESYNKKPILYLELQNLVPNNKVSLYLEVTARHCVPKNLQIEYQYFSTSGWKGFKPLNDQTHCLTQSGVLDIQIPSDIASNPKMLGSDNYWLAMTTSEGVPVKQQQALFKGLQILSIHCQAVTVRRSNCQNLRMGHVPVLSRDTIKEPKNPIIEIAQITQPFDSTGGKAANSDKQYRQYVAQRIATRDRAVSLADYQVLAKEANDEVYYAKCFADEQQSNVVFLGLVRRIANTNQPDAFRPALAQSASAAVNDFLLKRMPSHISLQVQNMRHQKIKITAKLSVQECENWEALKQSINHRLKLYLSPWIEANTSQITIDQGVSIAEIRNVILGFQQVMSVASLQIIVWFDGEQNSLKSDSGTVYPHGPQYLFVTVKEHDIVLQAS